jgi:hypothetical protein
MAERIYYRARNVCLKMLKTREYTIPASYSNTMTEKEFAIMFEAKQMDLTGIIDRENRPCYVKFLHPDYQFSKADEKKSLFKEIAKHFSQTVPSVTDDQSLAEATRDGKLRLIIVYSAVENGPSKFEKDYINDPFIELHQVHRLSIDPFECKYQKEWRLIHNQKEVAGILDRYDAKLLMLGSVAIDDPINRYYRGRPAENGHSAQVYEITRDGINIFYRKVITKKMNLKQGEAKD